MNFDNQHNDNLIILTGLGLKSLISPFLINCNVVSGLLKDPQPALSLTCTVIDQLA